MTKAWQQGRFDGLCGVYSLINAVDYLDRTFNEDDCGKLFEFLIKSAGTVFPPALYEGLAHEDLWCLGNQIHKHLGARMTLNLSRPYYRHAATEDAFFESLREHFKSKRMVALVGLGAPWFHWTLIKGVTPKAVAFHDSYGIKTRRRSALAFAEGADVIKIDYHQTILIERIS